MPSEPDLRFETGDEAAKYLASDYVRNLYDENQRLRAVLIEARAEVDKWGWGDFHYGPTDREPSVLEMLAKIDAVLGQGQERADDD